MDKEGIDICSTKCKPDCSTKQYLLGIKESTFENRAIVDLQHGSIPDIIVKHSLEMTLMSFICSFGGLLGMWLGLSILTISKDIFKFIHRFVINDRKIIYNNFINNFNMFQVKAKTKTPICPYWTDIG